MKPAHLFHGPLDPVSYTHLFTGGVLLALPIASARYPIPFIDALFMATSAVCVTGLAVVDPGSALNGFGQAVLLGLVQIGGLGITTLSVSYTHLDKCGGGVERHLTRYRANDPAS